VALVITAGWRFYIAYGYYGFDIFNSKRKAEIIEDLGLKSYGAVNEGYSFLDVLILKSPVMPHDQGAFLSTVASRYYAALSAHKIPLPGWQYAFMTVVVALALTQVVCAGFANAPRFRELWTDRVKRLHVVVFSGIPILVLAMAWSAWQKDYILAGILLFPVFVPVMAVISWGYYSAPKTAGRLRVAMVLVPTVIAIGNAIGHYRLAQFFQSPFRQWTDNWQIVVYSSSVIMGIISLLAIGRFWWKAPLDETGDSQPTASND
jgi:hypothetical protein